MCVIQTYEEPLKSWLYKESNLEKHMRTAHDEMACGEDLLANPVSRFETTMTYVAQLLKSLKSEVLATSHLGLGGGQQESLFTLDENTEKSTSGCTLKFLTELNGPLSHGPAIVPLCVRRMGNCSGNFSLLPSKAAS